jgi:uncharacterized protein (TIGR03118 family)
MRVRAATLRAGGRRMLIWSSFIPLLALQLVASPAVRADEESAFVQTNLISDLPGLARVQDLNLKNSWGIVHGPATPWWVADNNGNVSTLYDGTGTPFPPPSPTNPGPLAVNIPTPAAATGGTPTGIVFNSQVTDFMVSDGTKSGPSRFIFATEDGTIAGWSPAVSRAQALIAVDRSHVPSTAAGAVYKGLAIAPTPAGQMLYATNFRAGTVDVFDSSFNPVHKPGAFRDRRVPDGYAPFGIQEIGGQLFVSYARQNRARHDDLSGPGRGFVDVFSTGGSLVRRLIRRGALDSPWGLAIAPQGFGDHAGQLLVGNFGDGRINAYDTHSGELEGVLRRPDGKPFQVDGLWGIGFGNGTLAGPLTTLFFAAGINGEQDGLFGSLQAQGGGSAD